MPPRVSPEERWAELERLHGCGSPDDLHRALVLYRPAVFERETSMAIAWFRTAHRLDSTRRSQTAALLATDPRCKTIARPLMQHMTQLELIEPDELDVLAETFVRADRHLYWRCPEEWFDGPAIEIALDDTGDGSSESPDDMDRAELARRDVPAALRRWASARLTTNDPQRWAGLTTRARDLDGDAGGGIIRGLLDATDSLPAAAVDHIRALARTWPRKEVRAAADAEPRISRAAEQKTDAAQAEPKLDPMVGPARSAASPQPSLFD